MSRYFISNWNGVLTDLINAIVTSQKHEVTNKFDEADVIIQWEEKSDFARSMIRLAKSQGKKVFVYQHGRKGSTCYYPPFNEKILADKLLVWGQSDKDLLVKYGHPKKKIAVVGTSIFSNLEERMSHNDFNLIFSPEHWGIEVPENFTVAKWLRDIKGIKTYTKILPEHDKQRYQRTILSDRNTYEHWKIVADTLKTADVVVGISESTFELLAQYLDIPVIIADIWKPKSGANGDERYKEYLRLYSNAVTKVKTKEELEKAIQMYREHPEHLREERKRIVELEGGDNLDFLTEIKKHIM